MRERIAAAKALGNFKQYQATAALVEVLRRRQDDALRKQRPRVAGVARPAATAAGREAWAEFLHNPEGVKAGHTRGPRWSITCWS